MTFPAFKPALLGAALLCGTAVFSAAQAEEIKYLSDPVYEKLASEDPHPMEDLLLLGDQGDIRAQFILGDLYGKGKGGLPRNTKKSREWFEKSAKGGYAQSFIRLAALEKRVNKPEDAYKWYTLAVETLPSAEKKWAQTARDALTKEAGLTSAQIKAARKAAQDWKKAATEEQKAAKAALDAKAKAEAEAKAAKEKARDKEQKPEKKTEAEATIPAADSAEQTIEPAAGAETAEAATPEEAGASAAATPVIDMVDALTPGEEDTTSEPAAETTAEAKTETAPASN